MKRHLLVCTVIILAAFQLVGCAPSNPLIGTWTGTGSMQGAAATYVVTYAEKDVTTDMTISNPQIGTIGLKAIGTYVLKDNVVTTTVNNVIVDDSKVAAAMMPFIKSQLNNEELKAQMMKNPNATLTVVSNESIKLKTDNMPEISLQRQKG